MVSACPVRTRMAAFDIFRGTVKRQDLGRIAAADATNTGWTVMLPS
jgi:hypothetical protein